jgi:hypothetical protein
MRSGSESLAAFELNVSFVCRWTLGCLGIVTMYYMFSTVVDIGRRTAQLAETQVLDIYENVKNTSMTYNSCIF